jgi:hypothetical protein
VKIENRQGVIAALVVVAELVGEPLPGIGSEVDTYGPAAVQTIDKGASVNITGAIVLRSEQNDISVEAFGWVAKIAAPNADLIPRRIPTMTLLGGEHCGIGRGRLTPM